MFEKITAVLSVALIIVGTFFTNVLLGNPVSKALVTEKAEIYLNENYAGEGYVIESVNYDFKATQYYVSVNKSGSLDKHFTLYSGFDGKIGFDTYESDVVDKWNTADRICNEYISIVNALFESKEFSYDFSIAFGEIEFDDDDYGEDETVPDYAIDFDSLEIDGEYDIYEMGKKAGCFTVYVEDNEVSYEKLAEILLELKENADKEKVGFRAVSCVLEYPIDENLESRGGVVEVMRFAYDDIYEKDLTERVEEADKWVKAHYDAENELKYLGGY